MGIAVIQGPLGVAKEILSPFDLVLARKRSYRGRGAIGSLSPSRSPSVSASDGFVTRSGPFPKYKLDFRRAFNLRKKTNPRRPQTIPNALLAQRESIAGPLTGEMSKRGAFKIESR